MIQVDAKELIEAVVSDDLTREPLRNVWYDGKALIATNGHALASVRAPHIEGTPEDVVGPIAPHILKFLRDAVEADILDSPPNLREGYGINISDETVEIVGLATFRRVKAESATFPGTEKLIADARAGAEGGFTVRLNPKYLQRVVAALGCERGIELRFAKERPQTSPIVVLALTGQPNDVAIDDPRFVGLVMPIRS